MGAFVCGSGVSGQMSVSYIHLLRAGIFDKPLHVHPTIGPGYVLSVVALAALGAVLAALLPSLRASRLRPVEALDSL